MTVLTGILDNQTGLCGPAVGGIHMAQAGKSHDRTCREGLGKFHAGLISGIVRVMEIKIRELLGALQRSTLYRPDLRDFLRSGSGPSYFGKCRLRRMERVQCQ